MNAAHAVCRQLGFTGAVLFRCVCVCVCVVVRHPKKCVLDYIQFTVACVHLYIWTSNHMHSHGLQRDKNTPLRC